MDDLVIQALGGMIGSSPVAAVLWLWSRAERQRANDRDADLARAKADHLNDVLRFVSMHRTGTDSNED